MNLIKLLKSKSGETKASLLRQLRFARTGGGVEAAAIGLVKPILWKRRNQKSRRAFRNQDAQIVHTQHPDEREVAVKMVSTKGRCADERSLGNGNIAQAVRTKNGIAAAIC